MTKIYTEDQLAEFMYCEEYAEFIMNNGNSEYCIHNGDSLTIAMEEGYLFDEFLISLED